MLLLVIFETKNKKFLRVPLNQIFQTFETYFFPNFNKGDPYKIFNKKTPLGCIPAPTNFGVYSNI